MPNQREHSKQNWASGGSVEEINSGSLQRIADATEIMAQNYVTLQNDLKWYKGERTNCPMQMFDCSAALQPCRE